MLTNGEDRIVKLVCVMENGETGSPCGACRELLTQLGRTGPQIEILTCLDDVKTVRLSELLPDWRGKPRMK